MLVRFFRFLFWAMLGTEIASAQHGPDHVACEFKWMEAGKPADYQGFTEKCANERNPAARSMRSYRQLYLGYEAKQQQHFPMGILVPPHNLLLWRKIKCQVVTI